MKSLARWVIHLYPRVWRERYGEELDALLTESGHGWRAIPGLLLEALRMHLRMSTGRWVVSMAATGLLVAFAVSLRVPNRYLSTATLVLQTPDADHRQLFTDAIWLQQNVLGRKSLAPLIQEPALDLYKAERERLPLEDVMELMRREDLKIDLDMSGAGNQVVASVRYVGTNPRQVQATVERVVARMNELHQTREYQVGYPAAAGNGRSPGAATRLAVIDPPHPADGPVSPNRFVIAVMGLMAGVLCVGLAGLLRRFPRTCLILGVAVALCAVVVNEEVLPLPHSSAATLHTDSAETTRWVVENQNRFLTPNVRLKETGPRTLRLAAQHTNRFKAQQDVQSAISRIFDTNKRRSRDLGTARPWIDVLEPPSLADGDLGRTGDILPAAGAGLAIAALAVLISRRWKGAGLVPNHA